MLGASLYRDSRGFPPSVNQGQRHPLYWRKSDVLGAGVSRQQHWPLHLHVFTRHTNGSVTINWNKVRSAIIIRFQEQRSPERGTWYCIFEPEFTRQWKCPEVNRDILIYNVASARRFLYQLYWYSNSVCLSVCPSVCPLRSGILWKRLNISS